jgi:hypothetical protein
MESEKFDEVAAKVIPLSQSTASGPIDAVGIEVAIAL